MVVQMKLIRVAVRQCYSPLNFQNDKHVFVIMRLKYKHVLGISKTNCGPE